MQTAIIGKRWHVLETLAKANKWERYVELGVFRGRTFMYLLAKTNMTMLGVDLYRQPEGEGAEHYEFDMEELYRGAVESIRPYGSRAALLRTSTVEAASVVPDQGCDCVFIDADHRREHVRADIQAWRGKIKPGGWLMGHDWNWPGVRDGCRDCDIENPILFLDHVWGIPID